MKQKPRILLGLVEIAGYYSQLQAGFRELKVECDFFNLYQNTYQYPATELDNTLVKLCQLSSHEISHRLRRVSLFNLVIAICVYALRQIFMLCLFLTTLNKYDVYIFTYNTTFCFYLDLIVLKLLRKKVFYVYHGSDSRPLFYHPHFQLKDKSIKNRLKLIFLWLQKNKLRFIENLSTTTINRPPQAIFQKKPFILFDVLGLPSKPQKLPKHVIKSRRSTQKIIVHAPSNLLIKGTAVIRKTIDRLKVDHPGIVYQEFKNVTNDTVLKAIANCDLVVDQVYSDVSMPALSKEAAALGKPSIIGGYYADQIKRDIPKRNLPPTIFCQPEKLEATLRYYLSRPALLASIGQKNQQFVVREWSSVSVAQKYLQIINQKAPQNWWYNPSTTNYILGGGISRTLLRSNLSTLVKMFGISALMLRDNPKLESKLLAFIRH